MSDLISIIVPIYNTAPYLQECLQSLCEQTYPHIEIILVDDGSTDDSAAICADWANKDPRIHYIRQENGGLSAARNTGLAHANGDCLYFVDSDDYISTTLCETALKAMTETQADIVAFGAHRFHENGVFGTITNPRTGVLTREETIHAMCCGDLRDYAWSKLFRREVFDGVTFPVGRAFEDTAIAHRLYLNAQRICLIPDCLYFYRRRPGSVVAVMGERSLCDLFRARKQRYEALLPLYPAAAAEEQRQVAAAALAVFDRSLWDAVDTDVLSQATAYLQEHRTELLQKKQGFWITLYCRTQVGYRCLRRFKRAIGTLVKKVKR